MRSLELPKRAPTWPVAALAVVAGCDDAFRPDGFDAASSVAEVQPTTYDLVSVRPRPGQADEVAVITEGHRMTTLIVGSARLSARGQWNNPMVRSIEGVGAFLGADHPPVLGTVPPLGMSIWDIEDDATTFVPLPFVPEAFVLDAGRAVRLVDETPEATILYRWDGATLSVVDTLDIQGSDFAISPVDDRVAVTDPDLAIGGQGSAFEVLLPDVHFANLSFSPAGDSLCVETLGTIQVIDLDTRVVATLPSVVPSYLQFWGGTGIVVRNGLSGRSEVHRIAGEGWAVDTLDVPEHHEPVLDPEGPPALVRIENVVAAQVIESLGAPDARVRAGWTFPSSSPDGLAWSPDGRRLAYDADSLRIWTPGTDEQVVVTSPASGRALNWTPEGLLFLDFEEIVVVDPAFPPVIVDRRPLHGDPLVRTDRWLPHDAGGFLITGDERVGPDRYTLYHVSPDGEVVLVDRSSLPHLDLGGDPTAPRGRMLLLDDADRVAIEVDGTRATVVGTRQVLIARLIGDRAVVVQGRFSSLFGRGVVRIPIEGLASRAEP